MRVGLAAMAPALAKTSSAAAAMVGIRRMASSHLVLTGRTPAGISPVPAEDRAQNGNSRVTSMTFCGPCWGSPAVLLGVVMDLVQQTAAVRLEGTVDGAGRPAGIGAGRKAFAAPPRGIVADRQVALDQIHLFPIFVDERVGREHPRRKPQQPGAAAAAALLVERARQNLLL